MQEDLFSSAGRITNDSLSSSLSELTADLVSSTAPGQGSLFPRDLETTNYLIRNILYHLPRDNVQIVRLNFFCLCLKIDDVVVVVVIVVVVVVVLGEGSCHLVSEDMILKYISILIIGKLTSIVERRNLYSCIV